MRRARCLAAALACALAPITASAAPGTEPQRCQAARGVELIVGGSATPPCDAAWALQTPPPRTPASANSSPVASPLQVTAGEQRQRDQDRRAILTQELAQEQQRLAQLLLRRPGAESDGDHAALQRSRSNLLALQRELDRTERR
ncbi:hypothetical protein [Ideonella sp.]|uniref:hypothetical protein n=1 Tax=Ideonella sp. TaxID=1929293 RepID=UPI003BB4B309